MGRPGSLLRLFDTCRISDYKQRGVVKIQLALQGSGIKKEEEEDLGKVKIGTASKGPAALA